MKRVLLLAAILLSLPGAAEAALSKLPPAYLSTDQAAELQGQGFTEPVLRAERDGRTALIGFLLPGVTPEWAAGAYVWCSVDGTFVEVHANRTSNHPANLGIPLATTFLPDDRTRLRAAVEQLYEQCRRVATDQVARASRQAVQPKPAAARPVIPQPTNVKATLLDRALLATSSPVSFFWHEHPFLSLFAVVLLGCVLGARVRTRGPRPIEIRQDDVLTALAVSERKLAASRSRLQQLSSAIDAEEAQFVQRVSAIVERR